MLRFLGLSPALVALSLTSLATTASCLPSPESDSLSPRAVTKPAPISFPPAQNWEGIDGSWNTFVLQLGEPSQAVRVIISTASQQTWAVDPRGCPDDTAANQTCAESRGGTYNYALSKGTYTPIGLYDLWIESNLGLHGNAEYGYEKVGLGYPGEGGVALFNQTVGSLATQDFNFGHFGLNPKPTNFTNFTTQSPSFMTTLKEQAMIPSVSWGYTAGAPYRFAKVLASLTLGGYDSSRFVPNGISFPFAPDNERDILVSIAGIKSGDTNLLDKPVYAYIDSTIAELWLPIATCEKFEEAFGLKWDEDSELYLLTEGQHNALLVQNPTVTITVAPFTQLMGHTDSVDITFPYAAFDLEASPPYMGISSKSRYFPLRRASEEGEYTLGRTFLQEAYLTVDWERFNFSVSQVDWSSSAPKQKIVAITSANDTSNGGGLAGGASPSKMSPLGGGAIAGIAVGAVAIVSLSALGVLLYLRRKHKRDTDASSTDEKHPPKTMETEHSGDGGPEDTTVFPKAELDASEPKRYEADDIGYYKIGGLNGSSMSSSQARLVESDSKEREVFEMEGDMPRRQEADGRQMSEKEVMRHREGRINGTDPGVSPVTPNGSNPSPITPSGNTPFPPSLAERQRRLVRPGEVMEMGNIENATMQLVSPLDGSEGRGTMMWNMNTMSPLSPGTGTQVSPVNGTGSGGHKWNLHNAQALANLNGNASAGASPVTPGGETRKRFSYEDP